MIIVDKIIGSFLVIPLWDISYEYDNKINIEDQFYYSLP